MAFEPLWFVARDIGYIDLSFRLTHK